MNARELLEKWGNYEWKGLELHLDGALWTWDMAEEIKNLLNDDIPEFLHVGVFVGGIEVD